MSYGEYIARTLATAGMTDTRMDDPLEVIPNRVRGYQLVDGKLKNSEFVDISSRFAAAARVPRCPICSSLPKASFGKTLSADNMNLQATSMSTREGILTNLAWAGTTRPQNGRFAMIHGGSQRKPAPSSHFAPAKSGFRNRGQLREFRPWPYARVSHS